MTSLGWWCYLIVTIDCVCLNNSDYRYEYYLLYLLYNSSMVGLSWKSKIDRHSPETGSRIPMQTVSKTSNIEETSVWNLLITWRKRELDLFFSFFFLSHNPPEPFPIFATLIPPRCSNTCWSLESPINAYSNPISAHISTSSIISITYM